MHGEATTIFSCAGCVTAEANWPKSLFADYPAGEELRKLQGIAKLVKCMLRESVLPRSNGTHNLKVVLAVLSEVCAMNPGRDAGETRTTGQLARGYPRGRWSAALKLALLLFREGTRGTLSKLKRMWA